MWRRQRPGECSKTWGECLCAVGIGVGDLVVMLARGSPVASVTASSVASVTASSGATTMTSAAVALVMASVTSATVASETALAGFGNGVGDVGDGVVGDGVGDVGGGVVEMASAKSALVYSLAPSDARFRWHSRR